MNNYDNIIGFDYTDFAVWDKFVYDEILPLHNLILKLIKLRQYFKELPNDNFLILFRMNEKIREMFLGGINQDGEYKLNSIALLYKEVLGISLNVNEWIIYSKQKGIDVLDYVKINFTKPKFLLFIKEIKKILEKILKIKGILPTEIIQDDIKKFLDNPILLYNELKTMYPLIVNISPNSNYYTLFFLNSCCIPRFYIELAYPMLKDRFIELFNFLGIEQKYDLKTQKKNIDYTIWGHKEKGFADLVLSLNNIIWNYLSKTEEVLDNGELIKKSTLYLSLGKIENLIDLKKIFFSKIFPEIQNLQISNNISTKEIIKDMDTKMFECKTCKDAFNNPNCIEYSWGDRRIFTIKFHISDDFITQISHKLRYERNRGASAGTSGTTDRIHEEKFSLINLINNITPLLFFNIIKMELDTDKIIIKARN